MTGNEALEIIRVCIDSSKHIAIDEAWQTLFNIVLAQQTTNTRIIKLLSDLKDCISVRGDFIQKDSWFDEEISAVLAQLHNA